MSKFRGAGKKRGDEPLRMNTGPSIRGKTISQPIPFPDDDEFPIRTPGAGIALPLGADGIERLIDSRASQRDNYFSSQPGTAVSDFGSAESSNHQMPRDPPPPPPEAQVQRAEQAYQPAQPSGLRDSIISAPGVPSIEKPQRKKSSLRSVFGKLFGKKRKGSASSSSKGDTKSTNTRAEQHRSDPTALNKNSLTPINSQKRSASLPIDEFNRALRSHSVIAETFPLSDEYEHDVNRESLQTDTQGRPRRATTPSRLWTPKKMPGYVDWTGLSPRPASSQARGSKLITGAEADAAIGVARTSSQQQNRRSRSVGELQAASRSQTVTRRRSDDIRYWRESYDPGLLSPMSSNKAEIDEPILAEPEETQEEAKEQPQPFNFGPMGEMAGMKITQAASLETRVQRMEDRISRMERRSSTVRHDGSLQLQDPPKRNSARYRSTSGPRPPTVESEASLPKHPRYHEVHTRSSLRDRSTSHGSSRPSTTSTHATRLDVPSTTTSETEATLSANQNPARPLSTSTTISGIPSSSPTVEESLTGEHYTALTNMIVAEQAARRHLESVVHSLQRQLQAVLIGSTAAYPIPEPDMGIKHQQQPEPANHTYTNFDQDDSSDDDGRYLAEDFQTPNETSNQFGDEIFGDIDSNIEGRKTAPRTLSLSQITLGRGIQPSLNF